MLRYNRKTGRNQGVTSPCLRPVALASAPKSRTNNSFANSHLSGSNKSNIKKGDHGNDSDRNGDNDGNATLPTQLPKIDTFEVGSIEKPANHEGNYDYEEKYCNRRPLESLDNQNDGINTTKAVECSKSAIDRSTNNLTASSSLPEVIEVSLASTGSEMSSTELDSSSTASSSSSSSLLSLSQSSSTSPLVLDDRSIANIECLGLRLVYLLSNSAASLRCLQSNLRQLISVWLKRILDGIDGGLRRWMRMLASTKMKGKSENGHVSDVGGDGGLEARGRGSRHVFLVRHGQYLSKERSDREKRLTHLGREQLILTGRRLREVGFEYDAVVSSTMTRARESAKIIIDQLRNVGEVSPTDSLSSPLSISVDKLLEEGAPLPPEPPLDFWQPNAAQFRADGPRIERAFQKYFAKPKKAQEKDTHDIIVCHANVIRYCVCRALQVPPQAWLRIWLNHGSITWLTIRPEGRIVLRALGASGYMPPEKLTAN